MADAKRSPGTDAIDFSLTKSPVETSAVVASLSVFCTTKQEQVSQSVAEAKDIGAKELTERLG